MRQSSSMKYTSIMLALGLLVATMVAPTSQQMPSAVTTKNGTKTVSTGGANMATTQAHPASASANRQQDDEDDIEEEDDGEEEDDEDCDLEEPTPMAQTSSPTSKPAPVTVTNATIPHPMTTSNATSQNAAPQNGTANSIPEPVPEDNSAAQGATPHLNRVWSLTMFALFCGNALAMA